MFKAREERLVVLPAAICALFSMAFPSGVSGFLYEELGLKPGILRNAVNIDSRYVAVTTDVENSKPRMQRIFIMERDKKKELMEIDTLDAEGSVLFIEAARRNSLVVSYRSDYGYCNKLVRYTFDLKRKTVGSPSAEYSMKRIAGFIGNGRSIYGIACDSDSTVLVKIPASGKGGEISSPEFISRIGGDAIPSINGISAGNIPLMWSTPVYSGEEDIGEKQDASEYILVGGKWRKASNEAEKRWLGVISLPDLSIKVDAYDSIKNEIYSGNQKREGRRWVVAGGSGGDVAGILEFERGKAAPVFYEMKPEITLDKFRELRPDWNNGRGSPDRIRIRIGPQSLKDDRIWYGSTFYGGEGISGVGFLGWFDINTRKHHRMYLKEMIKWSCSAILAESGAVWIGLCHHGEGLTESKGLIQYRLSDGKVTSWDYPAEITAIYRDGNRIILGTSEGLGIVDKNGRIFRYLLTVGPGGDNSLEMFP